MGGGCEKKEVRGRRVTLEERGGKEGGRPGGRRGGAGGAGAGRRRRGGGGCCAQRRRRACRGRRACRRACARPSLAEVVVRVQRVQVVRGGLRLLVPPLRCVGRLLLGVMPREQFFLCLSVKSERGARRRLPALSVRRPRACALGGARDRRSRSASLCLSLSRSPARRAPGSGCKGRRRRSPSHGPARLFVLAMAVPLLSPLSPSLPCVSA